VKIAVYTPYLDTAGGGEKYMLTIAEYLSAKHTVDFLLGTHLHNTDVEVTKEKIQKLHDINLSKVNFIKAPIGQGSSAISRLLFLKKYDWLFFLSDGSLFYSSSKHSVIHLQSPITSRSNLTPKGKIKLSSWQLIMYNSEFTKKNAQKFWPKKGVVVYPPVSVEAIKPLTKKKQIISVGRFFGFLKLKKHELMIESFKKMLDLKLTSWSLHLVGGAGEDDQKYVEELKTQAKGLPIFFYPNLAFGDLVKMYGESQIYWHAAGYGESDPEEQEHFGITTVEAMAAGCVPVVINLGGQPEIVDSGKNGFLWNNLAELEKQTLELIEDQSLRKKLSKEAIDKSKIFSKEKFCENIERIISGDY